MNSRASDLRKIAGNWDEEISWSAGRQVAVLAAVWAACSLLLLLARPGYLFPRFEALDTWIYTAYQWDFRNQIADFGPTYYGSRLSWILPGAFIHWLLPPVAANLVFKLLVSAVFSTACAAVVRGALGFSGALLAVTLAVLSPQIILALQSDYIDTAVIVYATLALACITVAKDSSRWPAWIFLGGCAYTGMVIANLSALVSLGAGIAAFHLAWLRWDFRRQVISVGLYVVAAVAVCAALGLIHRMAGGEFHFLKPQIDMLGYMKGLKVNPWIPKDRLWFTQATWLWLPIGTLCWGAYCSLISPPAEERGRGLVRSLTTGLAVSLLLAGFLQVRELNATLSFSFYASFHLAFALPLLAACWKGTLPSRSSGAWLLATALALAVIAVAWPSGTAVTWLFRFLPFTRAANAVPLAITGLLLAGSALAAFARRRLADRAPAWLRPEILLVGLFICSMPIDFHGAFISDRLRERYESVHAAYRVLAREFALGSYRFWVDPGLRDDGISLASTKLWGFRLLTLNRFPQYDPGNFAALGEKNFLVVPSAPGHGTETIATATQVLRLANYDLVDARVLPVPGAKGTGFDLVCFRIQAIPIDPEGSGVGTIPAEVSLDLDFRSTPPYTQTLGWNLYADGAVAERAMDFSKGYPVFTRSDPRDHLATPFKELHPLPAGASRQVSIVATMPAAGDCVGVIQIDECVTIASITWTRPGRFVHTITVPADAKTIRLYLQGGTDQPTPLPTRITLYELIPTAPAGK
jgi:hypothetical protein